MIRINTMFWQFGSGLLFLATLYYD